MTTTDPLVDLGRMLLGLDRDALEALFAEMTPEDADVYETALAQADLEAFIAGREAGELRALIERDGPTWMSALFPSYARAGFAPHMRNTWEWVWSIRKGLRVPPRVDVWARGLGKSTTAESAVIALGARRARRYVLYVSGVQKQADKHVETIGAMLESPRLAALYPEMASRAVGKYGSSKGWSRTRLHTASGFVVDALGLQVSARGIRMEEDRPDLIILDDVDDQEDGPAMVEKKIDLITNTILPSGSPDLAVLAIQNVIHPTSVFARLAGVAEERADWLADRIVVGPIPAAEGLDVEVVEEDGRFRYLVRGGTPTWDGYGLPEIQAAIDTFGYSSFLREAQHEVAAKPGGMFDHLNFRHVKRIDVPPIVRWSCWVDPAVTDTDRSDSQGIQLDGRGSDGHLYRFFSWEARTTPQRALTLAIRTAVDYGAGKVGVETDQGGDTWYSVYREACDAVHRGDDGGTPVPRDRIPGFDHDKAGAGYGSKVHRASQMLAAYERAQAPIHVLGTHEVLERALRRFPRTKPLDLCLVAGTLVETSDGPVPIEDVEAGALVLTRAGMRPVTWGGQTGETADRWTLETDDGRLLTGTAGHPVWVEGEGWTALAAVPPDAKVLDEGAAVIRVRGVSATTAGSAEPVYNLTVAGEHEFFANGILTHNCDASWWSWHELDEGGETRMRAPEGTVQRPPINTRTPAGSTVSRGNGLTLGRVTRVR